jgi:hypothetical protein
LITASLEPIKVGDERGAELRIGRQFHLIGGLKEKSNPVLTLLFGDSCAEVMPNWCGMSAMLRRIFRGSAKDLRDALRGVLEVSGIHVPEEWLEKRIGWNLLIKSPG